MRNDVLLLPGASAIKLRVHAGGFWAVPGEPRVQPPVPPAAIEVALEHARGERYVKFSPMKAQRGSAVLMAMLIVAAVATLVAGAMWQQNALMRETAAEAAHAQARWLIRGAIDWAGVILREDGRTSSVDHRGEPWRCRSPTRGSTRTTAARRPISRALSRTSRPS